jgi:hypothetical protein
VAMAATCADRVVCVAGFGSDGSLPPRQPAAPRPCPELTGLVPGQNASAHKKRQVADPLMLHDRLPARRPLRLLACLQARPVCCNVGLHVGCMLTSPIWACT